MEVLIDGPLVFLRRQRSVRGLETGQNWQTWVKNQRRWKKNNRIYAHKSAGMNCEFQSTNSLQSVTWLKAPKQPLNCVVNNVWIYIFTVSCFYTDGWHMEGKPCRVKKQLMLAHGGALNCLMTMKALWINCSVFNSQLITSGRVQTWKRQMREYSYTKVALTPPAGCLDVDPWYFRRLHVF